MRHWWWMCALALAAESRAEEAWWKPYSPPCTERCAPDGFVFTQKPTVKNLGNDRYEIAFATKGYADVTVGIVDEKGVIVRHLASGVLGPNAPAPFQKNSLRQTIDWNGKDDLDVYHKEPEKLRVRVSLGLKASFDKQLGGTSPKNIPGFVLGIAVDEEGAYVFTRGEGSHNNVHLRRFDHDANHVASLAPPPARLPEERLGGRAYIEYEPGRRAHHGPDIADDMGYDGNVIPGLGKKSVADIQPVVVRKRIFFCNGGPGHRAGHDPSTLFYLFTDGGTDPRGLKGRPFYPWGGGGAMGTEHLWPRFAASPDGQWLYMVGLCGRGGNAPVVLRCSADGDDPAVPFLGLSSQKGKNYTFEPGSENGHFNNPTGIAVDSKGRIYVADQFNGRIQIFSPDGQHLQNVLVDRPTLIAVHQKTGAFYVQHLARVEGRSVNRLTKFTSFDQPVPEKRVDDIRTSSMALDSWTAKPRLWIGGGIHSQGSTIEALYRDSGPSVTVWEEDGDTFRKIADFEEEARKEAGENYMGRWSGSVYDHVICDPVREQLYFGIFRKNAHVFDIATGKLLRVVRFPGAMNDIAFDRRGYLHAHFDPGFYMPGVGRLDPFQASSFRDHIGKLHKNVTVYKEVPYDYGVEMTPEKKQGWIGGIPVKDQPGAKYFQDGFGVNMRGDVAVQSNIYWIPKMSEDGWAMADAGRGVRDATGQLSGPSRYPEFVRRVEEMEKRGEQVFSIPRRPGLPLAGATIWTYDASGELRDECAVIAGGTMAGVHMDEDGFLYFVSLRNKMVNGKPFLAGRGGNLGMDELINRHNRNPFAGVYIKARPRDVKFLHVKAHVPLDPPPTRPPDVMGCGPFGEPQPSSAAWIEGAEWIYAGVGPLSAKGCTCPSMRPHLDWYKRSFVPESYRHSIGVLDTAGNLIMHLGTYGNHDDALAMAKNPENIRLTLPRFISGTDNYLAFDDWGERLVVLKLHYHTEETAEIP